MQRRLAAIMAADVVNYSRLMGEDQTRTLDALRQLRKELFEPVVSSHNGTVVKRMGDGWLVEFAAVSDAVNCAIAVQEGLSAHEIIRLRTGIHIGEVVFEDEDVFGDGVNIAARLEELAGPGQVLISDTAYHSLDGAAAQQFGSGGNRQLKNISRQIAVWCWPENSVVADGTSVDETKPASDFDNRPAIAVLPFENMSNDPEQEYFADGIAEDILTRLAMWRWLPVIARNSSFTFKGQNVEIPDIGRKLGARYVLEGSVRKAGKRVRITGQLIDSETGHHLWADRYDGQIDDIFDLQDEITDAIVAVLEPIVGQAEAKRAHHLSAGDLGAWDMTQRAIWHFGKFTKPDLEIALEILRPVIDEHPDFAHALSYAAICHSFLALFTWTDNPQAELMQAGQLATASLTSDPMNPMGNAISGFIYAYQGRHAAGIETCRLAIELNPSYAMAYHMLGAVYMFDGQQNEAMAAIERAIRFSPFDIMLPVWLATLSASNYLSGNYESALEIADRAVQIAPHYPLALRGRPNALAQLGRMDEAREALEQFLAVSPNYTVASGRAGIPFREEAVFQHYMEGMRKAGLPDE